MAITADASVRSVHHLPPGAAATPRGPAGMQASQVRGAVAALLPCSMTTGRQTRSAMCGLTLEGARRQLQQQQCDASVWGQPSDTWGLI